jgi:hypothetical protein
MSFQMACGHLGYVDLAIFFSEPAIAGEALAPGLRELIFPERSVPSHETLLAQGMHQPQSLGAIGYKPEKASPLLGPGWCCTRERSRSSSRATSFGGPP